MPTIRIGDKCYNPLTMREEPCNDAPIISRAEPGKDPIPDSCCLPDTCCLKCEDLEFLKNCVELINSSAGRSDTADSALVLSPDLASEFSRVFNEGGCRFQIFTLPAPFLLDTVKAESVNCYTTLEIGNESISIEGAGGLVRQCLKFSGGVDGCPDFGICWDAVVVPSPGFPGNFTYQLNNITFCTNADEFETTGDCTECEGATPPTPCPPIDVDWESTPGGTHDFGAHDPGTTGITTNIVIDKPACCVDTEAFITTLDAGSGISASVTYSGTNPLPVSDGIGVYAISIDIDALAPSGNWTDLSLRVRFPNCETIEIPFEITIN